MNSRIALMGVLAALLTTPTRADQVLTFDTLSPNVLIPNGYGGLNWSNVYAINSASYQSNTGYNTGNVSTPNVASNGFGSTASFSSNTPFSVTTVYVTSADSPKNVIFQGFSGGTLVYNLTFSVVEAHPTLETLNFSEVTQVTYVAVGSIGNVVFDNLSIVNGALVFTSNFAATPGLTGNQRSVAGNIDLNSVAAPHVAAVVAGLNNVPAGSLPGAINQLTPTAFGQFTSTTANNNASFATEAMDDYLAGLRGSGGSFLGGNGGIDASRLTTNDPSYDPALAIVHSRLLAWNPAPYGAINDSASSVLGGVDMKDPKEMKAWPATAYNNPWNFYVSGNVVLAQGFSDGNVSHFDSNTSSVTLGTDYRINSNFLVGLSAGYGHTDSTLDNSGSSATVDSYSPGFYAGFADHGWYSNLSGNYLHNAYTQSRVIGFLGQTATSAPQGNQGVANLDGGYEFHLGKLTCGPLAGLQYTHLTVDGYHESGSDANLTVNSQDSDSLRSRLGGRISYAFAHCGFTFKPHLEATWQHEFMDQSRGITSQFDGAVGSFNVQTSNPSRDSALVDIGMDAEINQTVTVFADYEIQAGQENYFGQSIQGGVRIGF